MIFSVKSRYTQKVPGRTNYALVKKDLLFQLIRTNFKLKYNDSILGFLWVLLKPLLNFTVLYIVFSNLGRGAGIDNFPIYLLTGSILYTFFNEGIIYGMNSLLDKSHIILKVNFPRDIAIYSSLGLATVNFSVNIIILGIFAVFAHAQPTILSILYFFVPALITILITVSFSFFTSILLVRFRDLEHITELILQLGFFATPVFYSISILPATAQKFVKLNPLFYIITAAREAIIHGQIIYYKELLIIFGLAIVLFIFTYNYFIHNIKKIAEHF